jgi:multisubunit Na+/H+ antiporter MnhE subunit
VEITAWWASLAGVWLVTLNSYSVAELITAAVLAAPCAIAARAGRRAAGLRWQVSLRRSRWLLALLWAVGHDVVVVLSLALRRRTREGDDEFRTVPLSREHSDAARAGREAVITAVLSATPGTVVVDANEAHDELLVHAMPTGRTRLERELSR